jgi:pyridoxal phosphate enzyme (YggS family)
MLHSVDSLRLAQEVEKQAVKNNRTVKILLQVHTSGEETKFGCLPTEAVSLAKQIVTLPHVQLCGMMTLAKFSDDPEEVRPMFTLLRQIFQETQYVLNIPYFKELSMGMTNDYRVAIQEGATMIRVGTAIFGERHYT